jgi:uncharacterized membrane protein
MSDYLLVIVGWIHAIAAVSWLGGAVFFWVVLRPAIRSGTLPDAVMRFVGTEFSQIVTLSMWTLVITGGILMFNRLSGPSATLPYGAILGLKIALSAWMFFLVTGRRSRATTDGPTTANGTKRRLRKAVNSLGHINMTVVVGAIIFLLSDILRMLVERQLAG